MHSRMKNHSFGELIITDQVNVLKQLSLNKAYALEDLLIRIIFLFVPADLKLEYGKR